MTPQQMTMSAYEAILPGKYDEAEHMVLLALEELRGEASSDLHYALGLTGLGQVYLLQNVGLTALQNQRVFLRLTTRSLSLPVLPSKASKK